MEWSEEIEETLGLRLGQWEDKCVTERRLQPAHVPGQTVGKMSIWHWHEKKKRYFFFKYWSETKSQIALG